jgi:AcrR family transcriptional regulator
MATAEPAFQRARTPENKELRSRALITAARSLALDNGVRAVTLTDIAAAAGVHISAVRRYFESREEIFLHLTAEGWDDWARAVAEALGSRTQVPPGDLAAVLARALADRPLFCDLLAHTPLTLERQVSAEPVRAFKLSALSALSDLAGVLTRALPEHDERDARDLIAAVTALAASMWQVAHPPATLAALYREDPRLGHATADFVPRMTRLVHATTLGLIAARVS